MKATKMICLALALGLTSCTEIVKGIVMLAADKAMNFDYQDSEKLGCVVTQELALGDFDCMELGGAVRMVFTQDTAIVVRVEGNEKNVQRYTYEVERGALTVKMQDFNGTVNGDSPRITLYVSAPVLQTLDIHGAIKAEFKGKIDMPTHLTMEVHGAGQLFMEDMSLGGLKVDVHGAGDVNIQRVVCADDAELEVSGAGNIKANLVAKDISCDVSGAGDIDLTVDCGVLMVECRGASDAVLKGKCKSLKTSRGISNKVNAKGLTVKESEAHASQQNHPNVKVNM